jgi:hypothetical protein
MRTLEEVNAYNESFADWEAEINSGTERFYNSKRNCELLRDEMFKIQQTAEFVNNPVAVWNKRIWASVYSLVVSQLETRPMKTRQEREAELHVRDLRDGLQSRVKPRYEEDWQREERLEREKRAAFDAIQRAKQNVIAAAKAEDAALKLADDQRENPHRYCTKDFSVDISAEEAKAMPNPVYRYWLRKRREFQAEEAQRLAADKAAARALKNLK